MRVFATAQRGVSRLTLIVFGTVTAVVLYAGYQILPFYYYYFEMVNQMEAAIRVASEYNDAEIRKKLWYYVKRNQIPARPDDIKITRGAGTMSISLPYKEVFYVRWQGKDYDIYVFKFNAQASGKF